MDNPELSIPRGSALELTDTEDALFAVDATRATKPKLAYIYIIGPEHGAGPLKIGWAKDPYFRLQRLQTGHPEELTIWATIWGTRDEEQRLHGMFHSAKSRDRGEWFVLTDELRLLLEALNEDVSHKMPARVRTVTNIDRFMERFAWLLDRLDGPDPLEEEQLALARTVTNRL